MNLRLLLNGAAVLVGIVVLNTCRFWAYSGVGFSWDILIFGVPTVAFTWALLLMTSFVTTLWPQLARYAIAAIMVLQLAAFGYFLSGMFNWPEGREYAEQLALQWAVAIVILALMMALPEWRRRASRKGAPDDETG